MKNLKQEALLAAGPAKTFLGEKHSDHKEVTINAVVPVCPTVPFFPRARGKTLFFWNVLSRLPSPQSSRSHQ